MELNIKKLRHENEKLKRKLWDQYYQFKDELHSQKKENKTYQNAINNEKNKNRDIIQQFNERIRLLEDQLRMQRQQKMNAPPPPQFTKSYSTTFKPKPNFNFVFAELEEESQRLSEKTQRVFQKCREHNPIPNITPHPISHDLIREYVKPIETPLPCYSPLSQQKSRSMPIYQYKSSDDQSEEESSSTEEIDSSSPGVMENSSSSSSVEMKDPPKQIVKPKKEEKEKPVKQKKEEKLMPIKPKKEEKPKPLYNDFINNPLQAESSSTEHTLPSRYVTNNDTHPSNSSSTIPATDLVVLKPENKEILEKPVEVEKPKPMPKPEPKPKPSPEPKMDFDGLDFGNDGGWEVDDSSEILVDGNDLFNDINNNKSNFSDNSDTRIQQINLDEPKPKQNSIIEPKQISIIEPKSEKEQKNNPPTPKEQSNVEFDLSDFEIDLE